MILLKKSRRYDNPEGGYEVIVDFDKLAGDQMKTLESALRYTISYCDDNGFCLRDFYVGVNDGPFLFDNIKKYNVSLELADCTRVREKGGKAATGGQNE